MTLETTIYPDSAVCDDAFLSASLLYFDKIMVSRPCGQHEELDQRTVDMIRRSTVGGRRLASESLLRASLDKHRKLIAISNRLSMLTKKGIICHRPDIPDNTQ